MANRLVQAGSRIGSGALGVFTASGSGAVPRSVQDKLRDVVSVLDYGATGNGTTDDTAAIQACVDASLAVQARVYAPAGVYKISSKITAVSTATTLWNYAVIEGDGDGTVFAPSTAFPEITTDATSAVFNTDGGSNYPVQVTSCGPQFRNFKISFTQDFSGGDRTSLKKWTGLNLNNTLGPVVENVTIERTWNGISFKGTWNAGTSAWDGVTGRGFFSNVGIGAYNVGVDIDGMTDSSRFIAVHMWPFGGDFSAWWHDPAAIGYQVGRADDLSITNGLGITGTHFNFVAGADGNGGFTKITGYGFDGYQGIMMPDSGFTGSACHQVVISNSTASFDGAAAGGSGARFIKLNRGNITWSGGYIAALAFSGPVVEIDHSAAGVGSNVVFDNAGLSNLAVSGVKWFQQTNNASTDFLVIAIRNCTFFAYSTVADTAPFVSIEQADGGSWLCFQNNTFSWPGAVRAALAIAYDGHHVISGNNFFYTSAIDHWSTSYPATKAVGVYQTEQNQYWGESFRNLNVHLDAAGNALTLLGASPILRFSDTTGATDYGEVSYDAGNQYFDLFAAGNWNWRAGYVTAMQLTSIGDLLPKGQLYLGNDRKIYFSDTTTPTPVARPLIFADGSNDFHVGYQTAPNSGNGTLAMYAKGVKVFNVANPGTPSFAPETDNNSVLGGATRRFMAIYGKAITLSTISGVGASISLQSADGATESVSLYGQAAGTATYSLYFPPAQGAAGSTLLNNGSGVLSWSTAGGLPVSDATAIVKGSTDATKLMRFEVDGFTGSTTRVLTPPDADMTLAGQNYANVFTLDQTLSNDKAWYWKDSGGTARKLIYVDGSNDAHIGFQAAPASGNGVLSLYAKGAKILNLSNPGTLTFAPETDDAVILGTAIRRFTTIYGKAITLSTISGVGASISLQSADGATESVSLYGQAAGTATYSLYFPPAQGAAGSTLVNDGSGVFSWAASTAVAGASGQTLRHNGSAWVASSFLVNTGTGVGVGTASPVAPLDLYNASAINGPMLSIRSDFTAAGKFAMIRFGDQSQTTNYQKGAIIFEGVNGTARGRFHVALADTDGSGSVALSDARLTVNSAGNVGIGTTDDDGTPATGRLVVKGSTSNGTTNIIVGRDSDEANVLAVNTDGKLSTYAGAATAGMGVAPIVAAVTLTGQSASIGTTNLLASAPAGFYRITYYTHVTTAGAAGSLTFAGGWTYNGAAKSNGNGYADVAVDEGYRTESFAFQSDNANITYAMALSGGSGVAYSLSVSLERLN